MASRPPRPRWRRSEAALAAGLPPSAATSAAFLALQTLRLGGALRPGHARCSTPALEGARREGHAARQGSSTASAPRSRSRRARSTTRRSRRRPDCVLVDEQHFAVAAAARGRDRRRHRARELDAAAELVRQGDALGIAEDRTVHRPSYLTARGRLRIAAGAGARRASRTCCGAASGSRRWACAGRATGGRTRRRRWPRWATREAAARLAREQLAVARRRRRAAWRSGMSLRRAARGDRRATSGWRCSQEAVAVLERSGARLELAHALADLGAELGRCRPAARGPGRPAPGASARRRVRRRSRWRSAPGRSCRPGPGAARGSS